MVSLARLLADVVTIVRPVLSDRDAYHNPVEGSEARWASPARIVERSGEEPAPGEGTEVSGWTLVVPAGADLEGSDRVEWGGRVFEVVGPPVRARSPRGEHHLEAKLRLVE